MKNLLKVALGIIAYNNINNINSRPKTGTRTNMAKSQIPNNGGL